MVAGAPPTGYGTNEDPARTGGDGHAPILISGGADFVDLVGTSHGLVADNQYALYDDSLNGIHLSGIFDNLGSTSSDFSGPVANIGGAGHALPFDPGDTFSIGLPDVFSDARGGNPGGGSGGGPGGGGGGHGGGGSVPAAYTTHGGHGVEFHLTFDNSVGKAPAAFASVVEHVADFFASSLQDTLGITINIAVGYGEVDGYRLGPGALGSSVTQLQDVTAGDLSQTYGAAGYLSDVSFTGTAPAGSTLYVSYAEAKALNFAVPDTVDGWIGFSSQSGIFDYDNSDGLSAGSYDFYGTVAHEMTEVMGRILLVGGLINNAPSYMAYDFFHFSGSGVHDFAGDGGYFSIDNGATNLAFFNNASNGGDAGDWASSGTSISGGSTYDAFNAFGTPGVIAPITQTDLTTLHAVGFDIYQPATV